MARDGITSNIRAFESQVEVLAKRFGKSAKEIMLDQMRLWLVDLIKKSWPRTFAQGRKAVKRDLDKLFVVINDRSVLEFFQDDLRFSADLPRSVLFNLEGNQNRMSSWHERNRRRNGTVRYKSAIVAHVSGVDFVNEMYVPRQEFNKFLKLKQSSVGVLKAAWLPGADRFGAKAPAWVRKQQRRMGSAKDALTIEGNGFLLAVNSVPYASQKLKNIVAVAARTRDKDLEKNLERRLQKEANMFDRQRTKAPV